MDKNETVEVVETQNNDTVEQTEVVETKAVETPEARVSRLKRELKRAQQKAGIEEATEVKQEAKPFTLDRADKAFLNANGVRGQEEYDLVSEFVANTGKDIEEIVENKYFQAELKSTRAMTQSKAASDAVSGSKRGTPSARDTVEYWTARGELPPAYQSQLRRDVVNARIKNQTGGSKFSDNPVVS